MEDFLNAVQLLGTISGEPDSCPWSGFRPGMLSFCEAPVCGWIVSPAETWSNLLYFVIGFLLLKKYWKSETFSLRAFGWIALGVGVMSTFYHASHIYLAETLDLGALNVLAAWLVTLNWSRLKGASISAAQTAVIFLVMVIGGLVALLLLDGEARIAVFAVEVLVALALEWKVFLQGRESGKSYFWFKATLVFFAVAFVAWQLDFQRLVCNPENHFLSGHALWHLLNAFCFWSLARFYEGRLIFAGTGADPKSVTRSRPSLLEK